MNLLSVHGQTHGHIDIQMHSYQSFVLTVIIMWFMVNTLNDERMQGYERCKECRVIRYANFIFWT